MDSKESTNLKHTLFSIEKALLENGPDQKLVDGCDLCQQCFFYRFLLIQRTLKVCKEVEDQPNITKDC